MKLTPSDVIAILAYLAATMLLGLYFRHRAGRSTEDFFLSGRRAPWWLAGTSMVATTFAADTPLVVAGLVFTQGIAGNWLWWSFVPSGMLTVFLFARLWQRSGLLTDVQFAEMRYAGRPAAFLRGFRALYLGLLVNCLILGWVTKAMVSILTVSLGVTETAALLICIFFLIPFTGVYAALGGLWGVLWTDLAQFVFMMGIVILVAWFAVSAAGGLDAMLAQADVMRAGAGPAAGDPLAFLPDFSRGLTSEAAWTLPVLTFVVFLALQWWAFWYPGSEPGGGGYVAQRIFSARSERDGMLAVLWFNVAHYAVRPWPWILTALAAMVLYPGLEKPETGYMLLVAEHVPPALRGLVLAGFLAAFMSTMSTQLNWGASYLVNDLYRRFIRRDAAEKHYVAVSRLATLLLVVATGYVAASLASIRSGWEVLLQIGAGTGAVYLLRWYWWRINAWSEISAMVAALASTLWLQFAQPFAASPAPEIFAKSALLTTAITTAVWLAVTFATPAEPRDLLVAFYRKVRPDARGWRSVAAVSDVPAARDLGSNLLSWLLGCVMVYGLLLGVGKLLLGRPALGLLLALAGAACAAWLFRRLRAAPIS